MSSPSTPNDSPPSAPIQPIHNPSRAAHIVVPQAPLGNATNGTAVPGMGVKALLAKKMAKSSNPNFVSPTDNMVTPVTQKLNAARHKRFSKGAKPTGNLFFHNDDESSNEPPGESGAGISDSKSRVEPVHEGDNPFE